MGNIRWATSLVRKPMCETNQWCDIWLDVSIIKQLPVSSIDSARDHKGNIYRITYQLPSPQSRLKLFFAVILRIVQCFARGNCLFIMFVHISCVLLMTDRTWLYLQSICLFFLSLESDIVTRESEVPELSQLKTTTSCLSSNGIRAYVHRTGRRGC